MPFSFLYQFIPVGTTIVPAILPTSYIRKKVSKKRYFFPAIGGNCPLKPANSAVFKVFYTFCRLQAFDAFYRAFFTFWCIQTQL
jgi:hypothetical protein